MNKEAKTKTKTKTGASMDRLMSEMKKGFKLADERYNSLSSEMKKASTCR